MVHQIIVQPDLSFLFVRGRQDVVLQLRLGGRDGFALVLAEANLFFRLASHFCLTSQISHARRAGEPFLLNDWAMLSADIISESGEIKGVAAVAP
jgi:hypothetical protein